MMLAARQLLRLPVETRGGVRLGRLAGFQFEAESQTIVRYEVQRALFGAPFLVHRTQVISIDAKRMMVEDAAVPELLRARLALREPARESSAAPLTSEFTE